MAIAELQKLRQKYPQYNDMDDATLSTALAKKYPQYADLKDKVTPMFKTEGEGRQAISESLNTQKDLEYKARHPYLTAIGKSVQDFPAFANEAINTAVPIFSAIDAITGDKGSAFLPTKEQIEQNPIAEGTAQGIGFTVPAGLPMRVIKGAEVIRNPLTRSVVQGAGAMTTQIPNANRSTEEYATGIATGGALGVAGRGVEKVAEGAIQQAAKGVSGRIHDYLVKLPTGAFKWSKDPIKVASDESIVAGSMGEYAEKAGQRLAERSAQLDAAVQNSNKTVDVEEMVNRHLNEAASKLSGSLKDRTAQIAELNTVRDNLSAKYGDLKNLSVQDAIKLKRQLADDFPFVQEGAGDIATKSAHKIYHDINTFVEEVHPEVAELNQRVSGLIDIEKAARNRMAIESRNNPLGLVARLGAGGALIGGAALGHTPEGIISALGIMGFEKAIQSPAVLTRIAKALSAMSGQDRIKVMAAYPELNKVIKVDAR